MLFIYLSHWHSACDYSAMQNKGSQGLKMNPLLETADTAITHCGIPLLFQHPGSLHLSTPSQPWPSQTL